MQYFLEVKCKLVQGIKLKVFSLKYLLKLLIVTILVDNRFRITTINQN